MSLEKFGPLVRRRLRFFLSVEESPDERLLSFFQGAVIPAEATCDDVWALATRFAIAEVRAGRRRNLLGAPPPGSWAEQADAPSGNGWQSLNREWRETTPKLVELLVYADVDGMSAGQIADLTGETRSWVVDELHARAKRGSA